MEPILTVQMTPSSPYPTPYLSYSISPIKDFDNQAHGLISVYPSSISIPDLFSVTAGIFEFTVTASYPSVSPTLSTSYKLLIRVHDETCTTAWLTVSPTGPLSVEYHYEGEDKPAII